MKLSKLNKILLTGLYVSGLIFYTLMIFDVLDEGILSAILMYVFYGFSVLAVLKGLADFVIHKEVKDLVFLILSIIPFGILMLILLYGANALSYF